MINRLTIVLLTAAGFLLFGCTDDGGDSSSLFVISAQSGEVEGTKLTLNGVPSVVVFSERPARVSSHISVEQFIEAWDSGEDSFASDPPNADVSVLTDSGPTNTVVVLTSVSLDGSSLVFSIEVLDGVLDNGTLGAISVFVDNCGHNPLLPCPG